MASSWRFVRGSWYGQQLRQALLLLGFRGIRSERQIMERLEFDLLFRWFVGLGVDDDQTTSSKNPRRAAGRRHCRSVPAQGAGRCQGEAALSTEHFSVDGTLIEAWT